MEKDFIYYNIIAIKWGESTHFPGQNDPNSYKELPTIWIFEADNNNVVFAISRKIDKVYKVLLLIFSLDKWN